MVSFTSFSFSLSTWTFKSKEVCGVGQIRKKRARQGEEAATRDRETRSVKVRASGRGG